MQFPDVVRMASLMLETFSTFALQDSRGSVQLCGCHVVFSSERELFRGLRWKAYTGSFKSGGRERLFFP